MSKESQQDRAETDPVTDAADSADNVRRMDRAKQKVAETVDRTREVVGERLGVAREKFQDVASEVGERFQQASAGAHRAREVARDKAQHAREVARERYRTASAQVQDGYARVRKDVDYVVDDVNDFVRQKPGTAILIAAGAGFLLGLLFRGGGRRRYD